MSIDVDPVVPTADHPPPTAAGSNRRATRPRLRRPRGPAPAAPPTDPTATQSSVAWLGPRLASQGFIVITIDTLSGYDQPASRGTQLLAALDKAYLELNGASHSAPTSANVTVAKYSISWLKRFVDDDTRYEQFLCPAPRGTAIEEYRDTCPHS